MTARRAFQLGFLLVGLLLPADLVAQRPTLQLTDSAGHPAAISFDELTGYAGVTICWKGRAWSYIAEGMDSMSAAETRAHEAKHREQMQRYPSCTAFAEWYATPKGQISAETEAYAAGLCRWVELGGDGVSRRRSIQQLLERNFGPANLLVAIQLVEQHAKGCGLR